MASEWKEFSFKELLAEPVRNGIYKKKEFHGRGAKIVNMGELFAHPRLRSVTMRRVELNASEESRFLLEAGDLIFARRSLTAEGAGKCSVVLDVDEATTFESSIIRARPDKSKADSLYLYYFFNSPVGFHLLDTIRRQVAVAGITGGDLAKLVIPIPSLNEQRAIAHILGTLDDKIELNRKQNETLEAMARALFKAWFVDFEPVRAKMEGRWQRGQSLPGLPAHLYDLFPDKLVDSELGLIPEGWGAGCYTDVVEIIGGGTPKTSVDEYWGGDISWFSVVDTPAPGSVFVVETEKNITKEGLSNSSVRLIDRGVTIISARGTVGNLAIAGRSMTFNQSCYGLKGVDGFGNYYIYQSAQLMVDQLKAMAHGSVFSTITRSTFDSVRCILPSKVILGEYENAVGCMFDSILMNVQKSRSLTCLRDTLLPKLISGELRVSSLNEDATP
ncbi:hypothetical protein ABB25_04580 [Stenotrophomonas koreensis]|uniref:Type I restriction modification DNA specificity domain-containing protein n=1 Tax=Stenotrophomonas koreensis TaxID=266128 RepID=A0A0R0C1S6_9GAMM|nr:restriction endonuclease subunit S [Stenotrophomonas koreensis]KRG59790.1 hypothetical protein ABB25_04580 [Stenotrophomonas koreensis]